MFNPRLRYREHSHQCLTDMAANVHQQRGVLGTSWDQDSDKPWFHVMPRTGWLNDPNGPIFYKERYHM